MPRSCRAGAVGSPTVKVNGRGAGRQGDAIAGCTAVAVGSHDVMWMTYDRINPHHYKGDRRFEAIEVIEDWLGYNLGNCVKYVSRATASRTRILSSA